MSCWTVLRKRCRARQALARPIRSWHALLVPLALLLRTTWHFRGGSVGTAWVIVLSGFVFMCAGDVLFAYFTALGATGLDPFVHAAYIVAYGFIAAGVRRHLALVVS